MALRIDPTGKKYGRLTVICAYRHNGKTMCDVICECGNKSIVESYTLRTGKTKSCGCLSAETPRSNKLKLIGLRFGRLLVIGDGEKRKWKTNFRVRCDCGVEKDVVGYKLTCGSTTSCGCKKNEGSPTHGYSNTPTYTSWAGMKARCCNTNYPEYHLYGGRGICVCDRWLYFPNFLSDMGDVPEGYQIDRSDNDGDYEPGNCEWVTPKKNARNRRSNHLISYNGKDKTIMEWSEEIGMNYGTLKSRIRLGWEPVDAFFTPIRKRRKFRPKP